MVYYDQRGAGKTQIKTKSKPHEISLEYQIEDLRQTIEHVKTKYQTQKIFLVGHSWGSVLGIEYVKLYPNTVSAFIGMGQVVNFLAGEKTGYDYCLDVVTKRGKKGDVKKLTSLKGYPDSINGKNMLKLFMKLRSVQMKHKLAGYSGGNFKTISLFMKSPIFSLRDVSVQLSSLKTNRNLLESLLAYDTSGDTSYSIPIYFICGRNDWQVPSVLAEKYLDQITAPRKKVYWIGDAGHLLDIDNPLAFNAALKEIISVEAECT